MKFSHRSHPVLKFIEQANLGTAQVDNSDSTDYLNHKAYIENIWKENCKLFSARIDYITKPFEDAILRTSPKMLSEELKNSLPNQHGAIILEKQTFCYSINEYGDPQRRSISLFHFCGSFLIGVYIKEAGAPSHQFCFVSNVISMSMQDYLNINSAYLISILNFIKYAPIEVKYLKGRKKIHDITCKYVNNTESEIRILDSTWFTSLVKSEGFKVRGHFRLQPCGQNHKDRKLIWIKDFEKEGYTAHFKRPLHHPSIISTVWP